MPQPSIPYACARVSALSKGLLDQQTIKRMADGSLDEAMRTLLDVRYGNLPDATSADCERMIDNTRTQTAAEIRELSPKPAITDLFLLATDIQNLKVLLKARLLGTVDAELQAGGLYEREALSRAVAEQEDHGLSEPCPAACRVLHHQPRHAHGGNGGEKRVAEARSPVAANRNRQHKKQASEQYDNRKAKQDYLKR